APLAAIAAGDRSAAGAVQLANAPGVRAAAKAAGEAILRIAYFATRPGAAGEAKATATQLSKVIGPSHPRELRAEALRLMGIVGDDGVVNTLQRQLSDQEIR